MIWLKLIRIKNLILIGLSQLFIIYTLFEKVTTPAILFVFSTFCFAAAGNIINDVFDVIPDQINKPDKLIINTKISRKKAIRVFVFLNLLGLTSCFFQYSILNNPILLICLISIPFLLYIYSKHLKQRTLLGNILIALLTSLSVFLISSLFPNLKTHHNTIYVYSFLAFIINLIREITKDIEDINGDKKACLQTLPISIGIKRTVLLLKGMIAFTIFCLTAILYYIDTLIFKLFIFITIISPLCYCYYLIKSSHQKATFTKVSQLLKLVISFGILTLFFL